MRKSNTQKISEVLKEYIKAVDIEGKLKEIKLIDYWEEVIGKAIAQKTTKIYINKKTLYVHINSSVVKNELLYLKESLVKALNDKVGEVIIEKIVIK